MAPCTTNRLVGCAVLLEHHGCEKHHNDAIVADMEGVGEEIETMLRQWLSRRVMPL